MIEPAVPVGGAAHRSKAGRKPIPPEQRKVQITLTLRPETVIWLTARKKQDQALSHVIDDLVARAMARDDPTEY